MKRSIVVIMLMANTTWAAQTPFSRGVNLTGWFQTPSAQQIQFTKFTRQDFVNIKSLGCDVIRLPINLHFMTNGDPNYTIEPLFYFFLDQAVGWAEELGLHLILDNHTFDPAADTDPNIGDVLIRVWTQMAEHYKDRSNLIYYEILNEPHGISDQLWNSIQRQVIAAIRAVDSRHTIVVGPASWNTYYNLGYMPHYEDDNLIYTFHFYDPFLFTHQGASWTGPSMVQVTGIPFPYDANRMPDCPTELKNTWVGSSYTSYRNEGTVRRVKELIDIAADFQVARNVPLFCGEFGVYIPNSNNADRVYWYEIVRKYLEEKNLSWTIWDYKGGFGLFKKDSSELFDYDLNIPMVEALGLTAPPKKDFTIEPDTTGFDVYLDYIGPGIVESSWNNAGILDYYCDDNPASGLFCIHWAGVNQYDCISLRFSPVKDLTVLVDEGYADDFWVRCDNPAARIDIRFVDTKTDEPGDHPWRMRRTISSNLAQWNDEWQHLQLALSSFTEHGSWDDGWYNPQGDFDWAATENFEIVSEYSDLQGTNFHFDDIRILNPQVTD